MRRTSNANTKWVLAAASMLCLLTAPAPASNPWSESHDRAYLGVHVAEVPPGRISQLKLTDRSGALVLSIDQDGPACKAGVKENDVILAVNGKKVEDPDQLAELMATVPAGKPATLTVWRDGQSKDLKVVPGSRRMWMAHGPETTFAWAGTPAPTPNAMAPMPPVAAPFMPEFDVPIFTPGSSRGGVIVEPLTPQLADFFGVAHGQGLMVRSVQKGSPGASAGVKAGDVIIKVNGKEIHDIEDWRASLRGHTGKVSLGIVREKRQQILEMTLPGPGSSSQWRSEDVGDLQKSMNAWQQRMEKWQPNFDEQATQAMLLNNDELEQMQRNIDKSMKKIDPEIKKQTREIEKSMKQMEPELRKQTEQIQKRMHKMQPEIERQTREARKQVETMGPEIAKQTAEINKQMQTMAPEIAKHAAEMANAVKLNADEMKKMGDSIREQMKTLGPELQKQMEEFHKQMEEMKQDWKKDGAKPNEM